MSLLEFGLTHPESLSDSELKEILENRCIDFSNYKNSSRTVLIELYKRVALPLPQRNSDDTENSDAKRNDTNSTKTTLNEATKTQDSNYTITKLPIIETKQTSKRICLSNSSNDTKCNGSDKRISDGKHDEAPSKKRQKITWP